MTSNRSLGPIDPSTVQDSASDGLLSEDEQARFARIAARPRLSEILSLHDFEVRVCTCFLSSYIIHRCPREGGGEASDAREGVGILFVGCR